MTRVEHTPHASDPAVVVRGVHKHHGAVHALRGADLQISAGEICALLGPNGAGKSTLVHIVAGIQRPDRGEVRVLGTPVGTRRFPLPPPVGLAPQELGIYPMLSVSDNLRFFAELVGLSRKQAGARIDELCALLHLGALRARRASAMSGGERRRLHTAIALLHDPPVVLLDEPTVGADVETRAGLLELVRTLAAEGRAVCYSTHYLAEVEQLDCTTVLLDHGSVAYAGTVEGLTRLHGRSAVRVSFVGDPPDLEILRDGTRDGDTVTVDVADPDRATGALLAALRDDLDQLAAFEVLRPTFESAYLALLEQNRAAARIDTAPVPT